MEFMPLLKSFERDRSWVRYQIDSFNNFVDFGIQKVINDIGVINLVPETGESKLKFDRIEIGRPVIKEADGSVRQIFPNEARIRNLTYLAPIWVNIIPIFNGVQERSERVHIGDLPVMVKSKLCSTFGLDRNELVKNGEDPDDPGGYFIINGTERVLVLIEEIASNKPIYERNGEITSVRVNSERSGFKQRHLIERKPDGEITISFANIRRLPVIVLLKALELATDKEICSCVSDDPIILNELYVNLYESEITKPGEAVEIIGRKLRVAEDYREERVNQILDRYLLPHLGQERDKRMAKALYLARIIRKTIAVSLGMIPTDDIDHYSNKRLLMSGELIGQLFRSILLGRWGLIAKMTYNHQKLIKRHKATSIQAIIEANAVTKQILSSLATGNWIGGRTGVSQRLDRSCYVKTISHLRAVVSPLTSTQEHFKAREIHPTEFGRLCVDKDTEVLLGDGVISTAIKKLNNLSHTVLTYDIKTNRFLPSKIIDYQQFNPKKETYKIATNSGRSLIATEDHPVLTPQGWKYVSKLKKGDLVGVYPVIDKINDGKTEEKIIINEELIKKFYPHNATKIINRLKDKGFFPLTTSDSRLPILARIFGLLITDGFCGHPIELYLGEKSDVNALCYDISQLRLKPGEVKFERGEIEFNKRKIKHRIYTLQQGGVLRLVMILLGAPTKRKTDIGFRIPQWIFNSSKMVQREFLAGFLGGDGPKPRYVIEGENKNYSKVHLDPIIFHKRIDLINSGLEYAQDLRKLFEKLGIKISKIGIENGYKRKDGTETKKIMIRLSNSRENIANLTQKIGYRYCIMKQEMCNYIAEYLRIQKCRVKQREKIKANVMELYKKGLSRKEVASKLDLTSVGISRIRENYNGKIYKPHSFPKIHRWISGATKNIGRGAVWEEIIFINPVISKDVRDFTTNENSHSFIANGFITHNCPAETPEGSSIGLRKHLALLSEITPGLIERENEKVLKSLKVSS